MNATQTALRPLPGPAAGALVAAHHDPRPCVTNPPQWWETGDPGNAIAIDLCEHECPLKRTCRPEHREVGMIRSGVPYDDDGHAIVPMSAVAKHHQRITAMLDQGRTIPQIASVIGIRSQAIRTYLAVAA